MRNKGTIRFVNQGFSERGRTIEIRVINFDFRRFPVTYAVGMLYFVSSFKLATKIGFWYVAMASRILPLSLSLPPSLFLLFFFFFPYILSLIYRAYPNRANVIYTAHCARRIAKAVFEVTATRIHLLNQATARNLNPIV